MATKHGLLSMIVRQVHVVYADIKQKLFLNTVAMRKVCSSKFSLKNSDAMITGISQQAS